MPVSTWREPCDADDIFFTPWQHLGKSLAFGTTFVLLPTTCQPPACSHDCLPRSFWVVSLAAVPCKVAEALQRCVGPLDMHASSVQVPCACGPKDATCSQQRVILHDAGLYGYSSCRCDQRRRYCRVQAAAADAQRILGAAMLERLPVSNWHVFFTLAATFRAPHQSFQVAQHLKPFC